MKLLDMDKPASQAGPGPFDRVVLNSWGGGALLSKNDKVGGFELTFQKDWMEVPTRVPLRTIAALLTKQRGVFVQKFFTAEGSKGIRLHWRPATVEERIQAELEL